MSVHQLNHAHVQSLVDDRKVEIGKREAADLKVRRLNTQLMEQLQAAGEKRVQLVSGTVVQITSPDARRNIIGDRLLAQGVAPDVIANATQETPVTPFIRVDEPKTPKGAEVSTDPPAVAAAAAAEAPALQDDIVPTDTVN